jgi:hypothetical protein
MSKNQKNQLSNDMRKFIKQSEEGIEEMRRNRPPALGQKIPAAVKPFSRQ